MGILYVNTKIVSVITSARRVAVPPGILGKEGEVPQTELLDEFLEPT